MVGLSPQIAQSFFLPRSFIVLNMGLLIALKIKKLGLFKAIKKNCISFIFTSNSIFFLPGESKATLIASSACKIPMTPGTNLSFN
jgi:hypothetical protein